MFRVRTFFRPELFRCEWSPQAYLVGLYSGSLPSLLCLCSSGSLCRSLSLLCAAVRSGTSSSWLLTFADRLSLSLNTLQEKREKRWLFSSKIWLVHNLSQEFNENINYISNCIQSISNIEFNTEKAIKSEVEVWAIFLLQIQTILVAFFRLKSQAPLLFSPLSLIYFSKDVILRWVSLQRFTTVFQITQNRLLTFQSCGAAQHQHDHRRWLLSRQHPPCWRSFHIHREQIMPQHSSINYSSHWYGLCGYNKLILDISKGANIVVTSTILAHSYH